MTPAIMLTIGSVPISAWHLRDHAGDRPLILVLYVATVSAIVAWLTLPLIGWLPDPSTL